MDTKYTKNLCLFLDILGFSNLVLNEKGHLVLKVVNSVRQELMNNKQELRGVGYEPKATTFSDCIVFSIEAEESQIVESLNMLVTATVKMLQDVFIEHKISLRGGISYGELFHKESNVFGRAMIEAYQLESKYADWPRVVFSKDVVAHLQNNLDGLPSIGFHDYQDGFWGVDCLTRIQDEIEYESRFDEMNFIHHDSVKKLNVISDYVDELLRNNYGNPSVYSKYVKLKSRVDWLMKRFFPQPLLIPGT